MKKEFVPYELAVKLKELGFNEECLGYYTELENLVIKENIKQQDCSYGKYIAPLWQQAFDFLLDKIKMTNSLDFIQNDNDCFSLVENDGEQKDIVWKVSRTECLEKLIEIVSCKSEN